MTHIKNKSRYGFLDELIENTVFQWAKGAAGDPDGMIGGYRVDHPAVVWMSRKETFDKVVSGQSIYDMRTFQAEISGDNKDGSRMKILFLMTGKQRCGDKASAYKRTCIATDAC